MNRTIRTTAWVLLASVATATVVHAQGVVIQGTTSIQTIDMQPVVTDSVPIGQTDSLSSVLRTTPNGVVTQCSAGDTYCYYSQSAPRTSLMAMMQDFDVTAWGLGQGISVHAQLRARAAVGGARELWPQATQTFSVLAAYVQWDRSPFSAKLGRQWIASGLGMFNFDGANFTINPIPEIGLTAYGGGTLVQGLNEPLDAAELAPVEDIPPVDRSYLVGGIVQIRPSSFASFKVQYQREIRSDAGALYSERIAANAEFRAPFGTFGGDVTRDLATETFNDLDAHVTFDPIRGFTPRLEVRRYVPYFDLWTIWGAFSPVGYREANAGVDWDGDQGRLAFGVSGGRRTYENTYTGLSFLPLRSNGWHVGATGSVRPATAWTVQGSYDMDINYGASGTDGNVSVRWAPNDRGSLAVNGTAFQNLYEFTIGEGRVWGTGLEGTYRIGPDLNLVADAMVYRYTGRNQPTIADWDQRRASIRLDWRVGRDPGEWTVGPVRKP